nr:GFA family protein [Paracoccus liaowanqingii]
MTYSITDSPVYVYACHCLNCQTRSGSAFAEHAMVPVSAFACDGRIMGYKRLAHGVEFEEVFCAVCHTRVFNKNSLLADMIFLRAGTLAGSQTLNPIAHIWISRKQDWITLPEGIPAFAESPTPEEFGAAIQTAERRGHV